MFLGLFKSTAEIITNFEAPADAFEGATVFLAWYDYESYEGDAFVLYGRDDKLYEVHGGHCSCYGLEGQWEPEETTIQSLLHRLTEGGLGVSSWTNQNTYAAELKIVLDELEANRENLRKCEVRGSAGTMQPIEHQVAPA